MARYIDLDEAIRIAIQACVAAVGHGITQIDAVNIATALEDAPAADVAPRAEWISVEESVPDGCGRFLTVDTDGDILVCSYYPSLGWFCPVCNANPVTHWMPLPEPPKGD